MIHDIWIGDFWNSLLTATAIIEFIWLVVLLYIKFEEQATCS